MGLTFALCYSASGFFIAVESDPGMSAADTPALMTRSQCARAVELL